MPEAGDDPDEGGQLGDGVAILVVTDGVRRPRKASCRLTNTRAAKSGMATENATTQVVAVASSDDAVRNGWIMTTAIPMRPP